MLMNGTKQPIFDFTPTGLSAAEQLLVNITAQTIRKLAQTIAKTQIIMP
jgi:hypothetical protein